MGQLELSEFKRMQNPVYGPDLAPCNSFLFRYMKEQLKGRSFAEEEQLLSVLSERMSEIPPDMILRLFADWNRRLPLCLPIDGEYVEQGFDLLWFVTGSDKRARRVRV
jgi:hypothetical protein